MQKEKTPSREAQALDRLVNATREAYAASTELAAHFGPEHGRQPPTLGLARFVAAMDELTAAREAFDIVVSGSAQLRCWLTAPG